MVDTLSDNEGKIVGFIEWQIKVNEGNTEGWIEYIWLHKNYKSRKHIMLLARIIRKKCPQAKTVRWVRHKYNDRLSTYNISKLLKEGGA